MIKLLLVEDDLLIQKTVEKKFMKEGYEVICCGDGKEAIEQIKAILPDIVLTDMMLPYISGLEVVTAVKTIQEKNIPVIIFSSMGQENIVEEAFQLGADDYITKPFSLVELAIRIKKQLKIPANN